MQHTSCVPDLRKVCHQNRQYTGIVARSQRQRILIQFNGISGAAAAVSSRRGAWHSGQCSRRSQPYDSGAGVTPAFGAGQSLCALSVHAGSLTHISRNARAYVSPVYVTLTFERVELMTTTAFCYPARRGAGDCVECVIRRIDVLSVLAGRAGPAERCAAEGGPG